MQQLQSEILDFYKMHRQSLRALHNIMKENNLIKQDEVIIDPEISSEAKKMFGKVAFNHRREYQLSTSLSSLIIS